MFGEIRCAHLDNNCFADKLPAIYSAQLANIFPCTCLYSFRCLLFSLSSDTKRTCMSTSWACSCRSLTIGYSERFPRFACLLSIPCQPSTSLLVLTAWPKTLHVCGFHNSPSMTIGKMFLLVHVL